MPSVCIGTKRTMPLAYPPYSSRPAAQSASATIPVSATRPLTGSTLGMNDSPTTADPNKYLQEAREIKITFGDRQAGPPPPRLSLHSERKSLTGATYCRRAMMPTSSTCPSGTRQLAPHGLPSNLLPTAPPARSFRQHSPTRLALRTGISTTTTALVVPTTHRGSRRLGAPNV